jgi:Putative peptidoglycan binding domain
MPLTSPRFKNERDCKKIDEGHLFLHKGSKGRIVHLIQMALIDLGEVMPKSTKSAHYSPDGIFGNETVSAIKSFQFSKNLDSDGVIGKDTMRALDAEIGGFTHQIGLHFRSISLTNVSFDTLLNNTVAVYGQYGIKIVMKNGQSLLLSEEEQKRFEKVDQLCNWDLTVGEFNELHKLGAPAPETDVLVYFIKSFKKEKGLLGCGGHAKGRPACTVAQNGGPFDTAHEIGHVLLTSSFVPVHTVDTRNLMHSDYQPSSLVAFTEKQLAKIKTHPCCQKI